MTTTAFKVKLKVKVKVTLRLAVYRQSVSLGVKSLKTRDQKIFQLNSCGNSPYVTPSLRRRLVCLLSSQSQSHVTTDGQSASLSWNKAFVWVLRPDFYYCQKVAGVLMWGAFLDEMTGLSFTTEQHSTAQSFSGPSPVGLVTIFYCLIRIRDFPLLRLL
jgi:hypothetical protein